MTRRLWRCALTFALPLLAGCGLAALDDMDFRSGRVSITALDAAKAPVEGVSLELLLGDDAGAWSSWTGATNASGLASAEGVLNGEYVLKVTSPQGYALAAGQPGRVPVRVRSEETTSIVVQLQRTP